MTLYALYIVDTQGNIVHEQPKGCQFDNAYVHSIHATEKRISTPHPIVSDMGEGFSMIGLFSGVQPFIILPNYIVGVVVDTKENPDEIKKQLRKITNNVLLHVNEPTIDSYMEKLWGLVESGQWSQINLEKPVEAPNNSPNVSSKLPTMVYPSPTPSIFATPVPVKSPFESSAPTNLVETKPTTSIPNVSLITSSKSQDSDFNELLNLGENKQPAAFESSSSVSNSAKKSSSADPFGGTHSDPFGSSSHQDPFGSSSNRDPFGGSALPSSSISPTPKSIPNLSDIDDILGDSKTQPNGSERNEFDSNPFKSDPSKVDSSVDEFSDNPWGVDKPKKKEKEPDPFSDNPF